MRFKIDITNPKLDPKLIHTLFFALSSAFLSGGIFA